MVPVLSCYLTVKGGKDLVESGMLFIMSHMKTVTLREFKHQSRYQRMAHDGQPILVTHRGKPYFVAVPPQRTNTFLGAAQTGKPLTDKFLGTVLPEDEWHSAR